jgi:hypothetical protein
MIEAANAGCYPVAPFRLSYPETLPATCLYKTFDEAVDMIHLALIENKRITTKYKPEISWTREII